ncbi:MAG: hypothetical protein RIR52_134 [Acidobacteriota bacterium]|jgi:hypothetical protein
MASGRNVDPESRTASARLSVIAKGYRTGR